MCGIAGFCLSPKDRAKVNSKRLARDLLLSIEHRGTDATGFAFRDSNADIQVHKADKPATIFVKEGLCLPRRAGTAILHTRAATQGSALNPMNNHPVRSGNFVGVHNGIIWNDDDIFRALGDPRLRIAEVDSEAIWAAMMYGDIEPKEALEMVEGSAAVAWLHDFDNPHVVHLARASDNPLYIGLTKSGSTIFASTAVGVAHAAATVNLRMDKVIEAKDGEYFRVVDGMVQDHSTFKPAQRRRYTSTSYHHGYGGYTSVVRTVADRARNWVEENRHVGTQQLSLLPAHAGPTQYFGTDMLDIGRATPTMDTDQYYRVYAKREKEVEAWLESIQADNAEEDMEARTKAFYQLHATARPGTKIVTTVAGNLRYGEIVRLPDQFPDGLYVLRIWLPLDDREHGWEAVIVGRGAEEFTESSSPAPTAEELEAMIDAEEDEDVDARVLEIENMLAEGGW